EYDHAKRLSKITHPDGRVESFICPITVGIIDTKNGEGTKDKPAKLIPTDSISSEKVDNNSKTVTKYDIWGFAVEVIDPNGRTTEYKRDERGQVIEETQIVVDETGKQVGLNYRYEYDSRGNRVKEILPFNRGVRTWEYDLQTNAVKKFIDVTGETFIYEIDPRTGNTIKILSFDDEKSAAAYTEEFFSYSPPPVTNSSMPGGLLIARIDPAGYATGNAYDHKGNLIEKFQYAEGGEVHSATGNGEWKFDNLSPNKRYEVFQTWKKDIGNPARTRFDFFRQDKNEPIYQHTINQTLEPHRHIYGSLGQGENYQSIGRFNSGNSTLKITATKTDKGIGVVPTSTIRLVEIQSLAFYRYNKDGQLISETNSTGRKLEHSYDSSNRRIKTIDCDTQETEMYYDFAGRENYVKNVFGIINGKVFDEVDRVIEEFYFDPEVKPIDVAIRDNNAKRITNSINNLSPNKRYEVLVGWKVDAKKSIAAKFAVKSDGGDLLTKTIDQTIAAGKHPIAGVDCRAIGIIETKNGVVEIVLESDVDVSLTSLKLIEIKSQSRYRYDINSGNLIESIDQFGNATRYQYDKIGRRTKIISPTTDPKRLESISETVYDIAGNISKQINPYGYATEHFYNPFGEVVKTIQTDDDRRGTVRKLLSENRYDKFGRIIETINPAGQKTVSKYDIRGRVIETINNLGQSEKTEYDNRGNIVTTIDVAGNKTVFVYDVRGQRTTTILPKPSENESSPIIRQFYNAAGQLLSSVSSDGVVNSILYDKYKRNIANFTGLLLEKPTGIRGGKSIFTFRDISLNEDYDLFISWRPDPNAGKISVNFSYNDTYSTPKKISLGEIDLSKKPVRDSFLVPFCLDSYQRLTNNTKIFSNIATVEFEGEVKNVSIYLLRSQAMSRTNYNEKGQVQSQLDALGNSVVYQYDKFGRQVSVKRDGEEGSCCSEGKTFYNQFGQTFASLAPDGKLTIFGYDKLGRQDRSFSGTIIEIKSNEYKLQGLPIGEEFDIFVTKNKNEITDNDTEKFQLGDLIFVKQATIKSTESTFIGKLPTQAEQIAVMRKQAVQRVEFDFAGQTVASYDAKNNQTLYVRDSLGRQIVTIQPPSGKDNTRAAKESYFDLAGNTIAQIIVPFENDTLKPIESQKRITRMEYDQLNRVVKIIQPHDKVQGDGSVTRQEYDILGNVIKTTDPLGNETNYRYDNLGRKISETNAEGGITKFTYYSDGQMESLTDPVGNTTSWVYNLFGKVSREIVTLDKKMRARFFCYDANGNITIKVDRNNRVTTWSYDKHARPTSETWYASWRSFAENKTPIKKITTTYNHSGKIAKINDGNNEFNFAYGIFGNKITESQNLMDLAKPIEFNFVTDINGLNTEKVLKIGNKIDHVNNYEVDSLNRITN
ncbi:MAG: hypothetical protein LBH59_01225, partial [Planctomycetaceae bacterium]|nr:hypothetical protein [Planctomycetaceae bacterium]